MVPNPGRSDSNSFPATPNPLKVIIHVLWIHCQYTIQTQTYTYTNLKYKYWMRVPTSLLTLPSDVMILVLWHLPISELSRLSRTCHFLRVFVHEFGWPNYLRRHVHPSYSLSETRSHWDAFSQVRYDTLSDRAWLKKDFIAYPLSSPWPGKPKPTLAINSSRLVIAAGSTIYSYRFGASISVLQSPALRLEATFTLEGEQDQRRDVTSMAFVPDGGLQRTIYAAFDNGSIERICLPIPSIRGQEVKLQRRPDEVFNFNGCVDPIESLSSSSNLLLSISAAGIGTLTETSTAGLASQQIDLQTRGWACYLSVTSSTPFAAFGTSSNAALRIHSITNSALSSIPYANLHPGVKGVTGTRLSAVYGISRTPPSGPWGNSDQIIVSGWYDGLVRVHDLRSSSRVHREATGTGPAPLLPVMKLYDQFAFEPIYSIACGGGHASHVAAGCARHGVTSFWDVRSPAEGWSVHAPGNESSPVYSVHLDSSRLFGATQSRAFVYDFGPGVSNSTFPSLLYAKGYQGPKLKKSEGNDVGYYVTKYDHNRERIIT